MGRDPEFRDLDPLIARARVSGKHPPRQDRNKTIEEIVATLHRAGDIPEDFVAAVRKATDEIKAEEQRQLTEYVLRAKQSWT